ncbi:MAG TPA: hypothetical protein VGD10_05255 [Allosphingosinicella sp.]|uniref:hypothetical protein n=1 Tax=Allosphingosinicella sp. TaxID=2823234 RepID=UPI002EDB9C0D
MSVKPSAVALIAAPMIMAVTPAERPLSAAETTAIRHAIEVRLVDPSSAQFRMGPIRPASEYYCGLVNAKNRMGGYNGFEPFMVRFNPDRTIKIALLPGAAMGPFGGGDSAALRDALRQSIRQKCAESGYSTEY